MKKLLIAISLLLCLSIAGQAIALEIVYDNFALGGSTSASDTGYGWLPSRAVNGNPGDGYHSTDTSLVPPEEDIDHWWEVDMGDAYDFDRIEVANRSGFLARLNGSIVIALDAARNVVFTGPAIADAGMLVMYDNNGAGFTGIQYIRVEQDAAVLTLMEVRALRIATVMDPQEYVIPIPNAVAMETTPNATYPASNALDGVYDNFTHTDSGTPDNYWEMDLTETIDIPGVKVYNRTSCCGNRLINTVLSIMDEDRNIVFSRKFTADDGIGTGSIHSILTMTSGRYVRIGLENGERNGDNNFVISLAEVEIIDWVFPPTNGEIPPDGSIEVSPEQNLGWLPGADPNGVAHSGTAGYNLYLGTNEQDVFKREDSVHVGLFEVGNEFYDPALVKDTTYYWAVDQLIGLGDANTLRGNNWSFTTELTLPVIVTAPANAATIDGGYAAFSVEATDPLEGELAYAWRKVGDGAILSTTSTLEISDVTAADEGDYVCDIMNINTITTEPVSLSVAKPVVDWKFNETSGAVAADSSGNGIDGALGNGFTDADWIVDGGRTGLAGDNALSFSGDPNTSVLALDVDLTGMDVDNIFAGSSSWTIVMWVNFDAVPNKVTNIGGFGACSSTQADPFNDRYFASWSDGGLEFEYGGYGVWPGTALQAEWQMLAMSYDAVTQKFRMFYNGNQVAAPADTIPLVDTAENAFKINPGGYVLFSSDVGGTLGTLTGLVDDFSVWDGPLGTFELEMLTKGYGCLGQITGDINDDCQVNILDLAVAVDSWLGCAIVPDCL